MVSLVSSLTGDGHAQVSEVLQQGATQLALLTLTAPGSTSATFAPVQSLLALKDQITFAGDDGGTAHTSILGNQFSATAVPLPGALPLFAGGLGLWVCLVGGIGRA